MVPTNPECPRYLRYNFGMAWTIITIYTSKCAQMDPQQLLETSTFYSRWKKCDIEKTFGYVIDCHRQRHLAIIITNTVSGKYHRSSVINREINTKYQTIFISTTILTVFLKFCAIGLQVKQFRHSDVILS